MKQNLTLANPIKI